MLQERPSVSAASPSPSSLALMPQGLRGSYWGLMAFLERQVDVLRVDTSPAEPPMHSLDFNELSEGMRREMLMLYANNREMLYANNREMLDANNREMLDANNRLKSAGEVSIAPQDGQLDSLCHTSALHSFPVPCASGNGIAEKATECQEESWPCLPQDGPGNVEEDLEMVMGEMRKSKPTEDYYCQAKNVETYILGLIHRSPIPSLLRPNKPRTSLVHDGITVVRKSSFCCKEGQDLPLSCRAEGLSPWASSSLDQEPYELMPLHEDVHVNHLHQQQPPPPLQPGRYPRTRKPSLINNPHSASLDCPLSCRPTANQDPSSSEPDSPHHHSHQAPSSLPLPDPKLVNAQYIPAYPCQAPTRSFARAVLHSHRPPGGPKSSQSAFPPERSSIQQQQQLPPPLQMQSKSRGVPKKFRFSEERPAFKKPGKRACRSQSENSLLGQRGVPEHKYNTLEKDGGSGLGGGEGRGGGGGEGGGRGGQTRGKKTQLSSRGGSASSYRRWLSTLELSQDEQLPGLPLAPAAASQLEAGISRRNRKARPGPPRCAYAVSHPPLHMEHMERERAPLGQLIDCCTLPDHRESESSISEADSPASSSLSSDSDESSGFVWPQQLHLHLALPSPAGPSKGSLQPKAFVKIKASHALKKKILRFHTGSLKVMTTV
ncbi:dapper homolog 3 isoform X2 [Hypomesus transpacificus]|uniref:dapper homolog 3 isoform X2 n=1 Tax=Hypomesus transpacificus TaxID=137520 RepID=UPI001F07BCB0|nr:dapper homolog 3 isoform X2 [Hypomesus transpacificus]